MFWFIGIVVLLVFVLIRVVAGIPQQKLTSRRRIDGGKVLLTFRYTVRHGILGIRKRHFDKDWYGMGYTWCCPKTGEIADFDLALWLDGQDRDWRTREGMERDFDRSRKDDSL